MHKKTGTKAGSFAGALVGYAGINIPDFVSM